MRVKSDDSHQAALLRVCLSLAQTTPDQAECRGVLSDENRIVSQEEVVLRSRTPVLGVGSINLGPRSCCLMVSASYARATILIDSTQCV